ncbi:MAG TPA: thermonuclease family protein, partial [Micromonosporaceae bacterium]|nr:thermonuclease family protein [Micromonosporaceae bacterium]
MVSARQTKRRARETLWTIALLAVLIAGGVALTRWLDARRESAVPTPTATSTVPAGAEQVTVGFARDGDTLDAVAGTDRVQLRLLGIDAPEMHGADGQPQCYAREAYEELRRLAPNGARLWVLDDVQRLDPYQRILVYAWTTDGRFVNAELARG